MNVGRNDRCPCGSGRKYKQCHEGKQQEKTSRGLMLAVGALVVLGTAAIASSFVSKDEPAPAATQASAAAPAAPATPVAQPAGDPPPGKVWSKEHGHWHDIATGTNQKSPIQIDASGGLAPVVTTPGTKVPKLQPGPAPEGKIWSLEHGHWHDLVDKKSIKPTDEPIVASGPLSSPTAVRVLGQEIVHAQPAGPVPPGKVWSADHGHWHDKQ